MFLVAVSVTASRSRRLGNDRMHSPNSPRVQASRCLLLLFSLTYADRICDPPLLQEAALLSNDYCVHQLKALDSTQPRGLVSVPGTLADVVFVERGTGLVRRLEDTNGDGTPEKMITVGKANEYLNHGRAITWINRGSERAERAV